jgi:hypothetical protein
VLEVGLVKTVQMQTVTSGENQVIDSAQPCKKVFGRFFIGNVDRLAFGFSGNTARWIFSAVLEAITTWAPWEAASCATASPMPDEPPITTTRLFSKVFAFCIFVFSL